MSMAWVGTSADELLWGIVRKELPMGQQQTSHRLLASVPAGEDGRLTIERALALRAHQARLAADYAQRVEQARLDGHYRSMKQWIDEYRAAANRCRLLGEWIRRALIEAAYADVPDRSSVSQLVPSRAIDTPPTGEAA
jgi:hypothetical protein